MKHIIGRSNDIFFYKNMAAKEWLEVWYIDLDKCYTWHFEYKITNDNLYSALPGVLYDEYYQTEGACESFETNEELVAHLDDEIRSYVLKAGLI